MTCLGIQISHSQHLVTKDPRVRYGVEAHIHRKVHCAQHLRRHPCRVVIRSALLNLQELLAILQSQAQVPSRLGESIQLLLPQ
jgi:hypothetical protein